MTRQQVTREALWLGASAVAALVVALISLQVWDMSLRIPTAAFSDGLYSQMIIRSVIDTGWIGHNAQIGAPYGSSLYDMSVAYGDFTQLLLIKGLGWLSDDSSAVINVLFLLGFPLAAITSYPVLRDLRAAPVAAFVGAVLFATTHYHFARGTGHLFLGLAYSVPLACWLMYGVLRPERLFTRREGVEGLRGWRTPRTGVTIAAALVVGTSGIYYAVFALVIIAVLAPLVALSRRSARSLVVPAVVMAAVGFGALAVQLPSLRFHQQEGANTVVAVRQAFESEMYGLKVQELLMPPEGHRIGPIDDIGTRYRDLTPSLGEGESVAIGGLAVIGLALALFAAFGALLGARGDAPPGSRRQVLRDTGLLILTAVLIATIGGISAVIAYNVTPQVRAWNRMSVVIAFLAIVAVALALSALLERVRGRGWKAVPAAALVVLIGALGVWEQTTPNTNDYAAIAQKWRTDARFAAAIEQQLPAGSEVLQLPYVPFPENPVVNEMIDYQHFRMYVAGSGKLEWSYGASKGRQPEDWGARTAGMPTDELVAGAVSAGFDGIYVDSDGYADRGAALLAELRRETGREPLVSGDGELQFFDLQPLSAEVKSTVPAPEVTAARREFLGSEVTATYGAGFFGPETDRESTWNWAGPESDITLQNLASRPRSIKLSMQLFSPSGQSQLVRVVPPAGAPVEIRTTPGQQSAFERILTIPPGQSTLHLSTDAPRVQGDPRDLHLQVIDLSTGRDAIGAVADAIDEQTEPEPRPKQAR